MTAAAASPWRRRIAIAGGIGLTLLALLALRMAAAEIRPGEVVAALGAIAPVRVGAALVLTAVSYLLLTGYDAIALDAIGRPQRWRTAAAGALIGQTFGYNLGLSALTANAARLRVYAARGLSAGEVMQVGAIASLAFWSGVAALAGLALLLTPPAAALAGRQALAALLLIAALAAPLLRLAGVRRLGRGRIYLPLPRGGALAGLAAVAAGELLAAAGALFVLMPTTTAGGFPVFFLAYALAIVVATISHVPGGLGVFEAVLLTAHAGDRTATAAALILYRVIYYLLPLAIAVGAVVLRETPAVRRAGALVASIAAGAGRAIAPGVATLLVFVSGVVLLASGALPGIGSRLDALDGLVPLPIIESSHLAGSLIGTALLLVTPALHARLRSAWLAARPLLLAGALFSLAKGLDYEEALLQLAVLAVLQAGRRGFYRRGGFASEPLEPRWLIAAAAAVGLSIGAGLLAYRHVPYSDDLWWQFALEGDAPRFLRATFGAGVLLVAAASWQLFLGRPARTEAGALPPAVAARALAAAGRTDANLAFTGDKRFIVAPDGDAFIMYGVRGRTWVVMGDPVGPVAAWEGLAWRLRRACDLAAARLCFYQVSGAMLPILVDLGMSVLKYGEEAHVALASFSLDGRAAKDFRAALRRADAAGLSFEVVPADRIDDVIDELRTVSDAWLAGERGREKGFSLGAFDPAYLRRFPVAIVRRAGQAVAFANIWTAAIGGEVSVDLMRPLPDQPGGTMDMMFVRLFAWAQEQGYERFNLGVAPLSGLPRDLLAPTWAKIGRFVFERGDRLYRFQGLRAFKAKFRPTWHPRYVGHPRGVQALPALVGLVAIVNRSAARRGDASNAGSEAD